jgi:uncharacterized protein (DUF4415 family)
MGENIITRYSTLEIDALLKQGKDQSLAAPPESSDPGDALPKGFWANAVLVDPANRKSVHLRINADVYDFFVKDTGGKGHIAKMQAVLKAYADAHR